VNEGKQDEVVPGKAKEILARCIELNKQKGEAQKKLDAVVDELKKVKEQVKDIFIEMGVKSMKFGKTVYLSKQIWAGTGVDATNRDVTKALETLGLEEYITYNHQSMSAYVRELAKGHATDHPEWIGEDGELIADIDQIVSILPEPLNKLIKVTETIDIRIRN
jgi:hypothetical protein